jgi:hypothetical protein
LSENHDIPCFVVLSYHQVHSVRGRHDSNGGVQVTGHQVGMVMVVQAFWPIKSTQVQRGDSGRLRTSGETTTTHPPHAPIPKIRPIHYHSAPLHHPFAPLTPLTKEGHCSKRALCATSTPDIAISMISLVAQLELC